MKTTYKYLFLLIFPLLFLGLYFSDGNYNTNDRTVIRQQVPFDVNNISTFIWNTGVLDQDLRTNNTPGFQWPKGAGKFAIFTAGFTIGAYVNGGLRLATASYSGEYSPGHCIDSVFFTDSRFKHYSVMPTDNYINNPDWLNWGLMVPYGAPYVDVNNNGTYEFVVDTPGVRGADQTIFICLTDADPANHHNSEGFSGGTRPLGAEVHLTAWAYNITGLQDIQFLKWEVINKNVFSWDSTYFSIVCDPDLGDATDDYLGCDTIRRLGFGYNSDNQDGTGSGITYGANPPSAGFLILKSAVLKNVVPNIFLGITSYVYFMGTGAGGPLCETDPAAILHSYNYMRGIKKDGTSWVCPVLNPPRRTKFVYTGDPETNTGWNEYQGRVENCNGDTVGNIVMPAPAGDRKFVMSSGSGNLILNPGDTQTIIIAQLIARGNSNLNSVTLLKQLADVAIQLYNNGFVIGVEPISSEIPQQFVLYQNYPNPFNPSTKIKFSIPTLLNPPFAKEGKAKPGGFVQLVIYDILGREIETLINEQLKSGTYEVEWNGSDYSSGVYFYKLITGDYTETRKMVLLK